MKKRKLLAVLLAACLLCGCGGPAIGEETVPSGEAAIPAGPAEPVDFRSMSWEEIFASGEALTWVFAGDSITHCGNWSQGMNSYSEWFEQYLYDAGRRSDSVILTAWGGADIFDFQTVENTPGDNGAANNPGMGIEQFITRYNPDVVFIKLGMNDRYKDNATFAEFYQKMLDSTYELCLPQGKIPKLVLLSPTPVSGDSIYNREEGENEADSSTTWRQRALIEQIAADNGLTFVDLQTAFTKEALTLGADYHRTFFSDPSDGALHPNAAGQYLIFRTLSESLGIYDSSMTVFQQDYEDLRLGQLWVDETGGVDCYGDYTLAGAASNWNYTVMENELWLVAGGSRMASYPGAVGNRSLFRLLDNVMRGGGNNNASYRDVRMAGIAAPGRTVQELLENWDTLAGRFDWQVLLLLPEIPELFSGDYVHSVEAVTAWAQTVRSVLDKAEGKYTVLWTPLADGNATVNGYINDYADAIRQLVTEDAQVQGGTSKILFFDANKFMNENMEANPSLRANWFEEGGYLSPLGALDVAAGFYTHTAFWFTGTGSGELTAHNLRLTRDNRVFKGSYVRDYLDFVSGVDTEGNVTVDVTAIREKYPQISNLRLAILPEIGAGDTNPYIWDHFRAVDDTVVSFSVPYENTVLTLYGELNGLTYRFRDTAVTVAPDRVSGEVRPVYVTDCLLDLAVVGAPGLEFRANVTEYDVTLYQYQRNIQLLAQGGGNLVISLTDEKGGAYCVEPGVLSEPIPVEEGSTTLTVKVSGEGVMENSYTLNLTRPSCPDIIITEVMTDGYKKYEGEGSDNYELIEIYNASGRDLDLTDYSIGYKFDYSYASQEVTGGQWPYYFTGNDQAFQSTSSDSAVYTAINPITKYSTYWENVREPEYINFPADSTMVIWVKYPRGTSDAQGYSQRLTYETLRAALLAHAGTHTLQTEVDGVLTAVVPAETQMVMAEIPAGHTTEFYTARAKTRPEDSAGYFFMDNRKDTNIKTWLFVLADTAKPASNGAITEAGDDIISAAKFTQLTKNGDKLSSVLSYDHLRGMSVVKNEGSWSEDLEGCYTSAQQGYLNKTSFGAIEYWQKPADLSDTCLPEVKITVSGGMLIAELSDDRDLRYFELHVQTDSGEWVTVTRDFVLESCLKNGGKAAATKSARVTLELTGDAENVRYYCWAYDGNGSAGFYRGPIPDDAVLTLESMDSVTEN